MTIKILSCAVLAAALTGCGKNNQSSSSVAGGGRSTLRKAPAYKATDKELVQGANNVQAYSSPDAARQALKRKPDQTVQGDDGVVTQYYNGDQTNANSERLRLRYAQNRLIGKEIVPAEGSTSAPAVVNTSAGNAGAVNVQGLDTESAAARSANSSSYGTNNYYGNGTTQSNGSLRGGSSSDRANSRANDDFNSKLNASQRRY